MTDKLFLIVHPSMLRIARDFWGPAVDVIEQKPIPLEPPQMACKPKPRPKTKPGK